MGKNYERFKGRRSVKGDFGKGTLVSLFFFRLLLLPKARRDCSGQLWTAPHLYELSSTRGTNFGRTLIGHSAHDALWNTRANATRSPPVTLRQAAHNAPLLEEAK